MVDASHIEVHSYESGTQGVNFDRGLECRNLLANPGYDLDRNVTQAETPQMAVVIPPKKNRTQLRTYDRELYRLRHRLENPFL